MRSESPTARSITLYLSKATIAELEALASEESRSVSNGAELLLKEALEARKQEKAA